TGSYRAITAAYHDNRHASPREELSLDRPRRARHRTQGSEEAGTMSAVMEQYPRRATRQNVEPPRQGALDMARRCRYLALLRRWAQERLPAGTRAALAAH